MYRVLCEWDIGLERTVFRSHTAAMLAARNAVEDCGILNGGMTWNDVLQDDLIVIEKVEVVE